MWTGESEAEVSTCWGGEEYDERGKGLGWFVGDVLRLGCRLLSVIVRSAVRWWGRIGIGQ
jgi:hypothetical protein